MGNSTRLLNQISPNQAQKEVTANDNIDACDPSSIFGRRTPQAGLTWTYYGGILTVDGVLTAIANGSVTLATGATNFVERDRTGTVSSNITAFTPGRVPLYQVVTSGSLVTSWIDYRQPAVRKAGRLVKALPANADYTLTAAEASCEFLEFSGGTTLTATRNIFVPLAVQPWVVLNNSAGGQSLQFIGASGTGTTVANGKRAFIYADGTNVVRVTADV